MSGRCTRTSFYFNGQKRFYKDTSLFARRYDGKIVSVRTWKDLKKLESSSLEAGQLWNYKVVACPVGTSAEDASLAFHSKDTPFEVAYLDERSMRGKRPKLPTDMDASFLNVLDFVGDIHGCYNTLEELLGLLGYDENYIHPDGRLLCFLGDFADKNLVSGNNATSLKTVSGLLLTGRAIAVLGNHDSKLLRTLKAVRQAQEFYETNETVPKGFRGHQELVKELVDSLNSNDGSLASALNAAAVFQQKNSPKYGINHTLVDIANDPQSDDLITDVIEAFGSLPHQLICDDGRVVAAHAGLKSKMIGKDDKRAQSFALYGDVSHEVDANGFPIRNDWMSRYDGSPIIVHGHEIQEKGPVVTGKVYSIDTGAYEANGELDRGLTALRYPEMELVSHPTDVRDFDMPVVPSFSYKDIVTSTPKIAPPVVRDSLNHPVLKLLADRFEKAGVPIFLVGGAVRDALSGAVVDDLDLTTPAAPEIVKTIIEDLGSTWDMGGEQHGTVSVDINGEKVEITTFRTDTYEGDRKNPSTEYVKTIEEDLARRDFTINAMALSLSTGDLVDPFNGQQDLENKVLRTPLDPVSTFADDPLRMDRAARFVARDAMVLDTSCEEAIRTMGPSLLDDISRERHTAEIEKVNNSSSSGALARMLRHTKDLGISGNVFGELANTDELCDAVEVISSPEDRLSAIAYATGTAAEKEFVRLKFTKSQAKRAAKVASYVDVVSAAGSKVDARRILSSPGDIELIESAASVASSFGKQTPFLDVVHSVVAAGEKPWIPVVSGDDILTSARLVDPAVKPGRWIGAAMLAVKEEFHKNPGLSKVEAIEISLSFLE